MSKGIFRIFLAITAVISVGLCTAVYGLVTTSIQLTQFIRSFATPRFLVTITAQEEPLRNPVEIKKALNDQWLTTLAAAAPGSDPELIAQSIVYEVDAQNPIVQIEIKNNGLQAENVQITIISVNPIDKNTLSIENHEQCSPQFKDDITLSVACDRLTKGDTLQISMKFTVQQKFIRTFGIEIVDENDPNRGIEPIEKSSRIGMVFVNADQTNSMSEEITWQTNISKKSASNLWVGKLTRIIVGVFIVLFFVFRIDRKIFWYLLSLVIRRTT